MSNKIKPCHGGVVFRTVRIGDCLEKIEYFFGGIAVVVFFLAVCANVASRELPFFKTLMWAEEVTRFGYIWAVFLGSGIVMRYGKHFTIDVITAPFKGKPAGKAFDIFQSSVILGFASIICFYGVRFSIMSIQRLSQPSQIPMTFANICIPIGMAFMAYFMIEHFILLFSGTTVEEVHGKLKEDHQ
ncbi:MAG: TRAP transporter small permease [Eubacterium sp.]|nr:TRAP transporter small permease [Eubacterium sp.]